MFEVSCGDESYKVSFRYTEIGEGKRTRKATFAEIKSPDAIYVGQAICNPVDHFDKKVGRKVALARALSFFDRSVRKDFWDQYQSRFTW